MNDDLGFFIESLTLKGPAKADAQLTFADGAFTRTHFSKRPSGRYGLFAK